jgi:hypothetical protein
MAAGLLILLGASAGRAGPLHDRHELEQVNRHLHGQVVDFTDNHGQDRRFWSCALKEKRDLYVYLPPNYDPGQPYPIALWLHMGREDERDFLEGIVQEFDRAIECGELPPLIVAAPDGSLRGCPRVFAAGSFFINSLAGRFEDFIVQDVWDFVTSHFPVRPERGAHALIGASMGGFASYNLSIKYRERFKIIGALIAPLNVRWIDCHGRYRSNFDAACWDWRTEFPPYEIVACIRGIPVMMKHFTDPLFGRGPAVLPAISSENPVEMLMSHDVKPGEFDMYVGYGGKDELNIDAQVESFLQVAQERGLDVHVAYLPNGRHSKGTLLQLLPSAVRWMGTRLAPAAPAAPAEEKPAAPVE